MKFTVFICSSLVVLSACNRPQSVKEEGAATTTPVTAPVDDAVVIGEQSEPDTLKGSLRAKASGTIGRTKFTVRYHSPAVRGRIIWGGLVPLDQVWVTGAHMATSVEIDQNVMIAGTPVPAGKYAFFTIPTKESWIIILNANWEQHLTDEYSKEMDVLRFTMKPIVKNANQERLQYRVEQEGATNGKLVMRWEKLEVALPVTVLE